MLQRNSAIAACLGIFAVVFFAPQCIADGPGQNAGALDDDPCLAFALPNADVLFNSSKKVFAHYFYPFPLSINNKSASDDYYNANYLNRNGESGKWAASGGYLRQVRGDRRFVAFSNERQQQSIVNEHHQRAKPQC